MSYLLDTHTLLWAVFAPEKLSKKAKLVMTDPDQTLFISAVSFWEISLKYALGRLKLTHCSPEDLPDIARQMGIEPLVLDDDLAARFHRLPRISHKDPFDRMIIWQAIEKNLILISKDRQFDDYKQYNLRTLW